MKTIKLKEFKSPVGKVVDAHYISLIHIMKAVSLFLSIMGKILKELQLILLKFLNIEVELILLQIHLGRL